MLRSDPSPPPFVRLASHPVRWRLLSELAASDHRVRELVDLLGQPQNLVSYHLRLLRAAALVTSRRSSFDARDSYYHLDLDRCGELMAGIGCTLHPALQLEPAAPAVPASRPRLRLLFACTGNSARSPMAEALLRHRTGGAVDVLSAGSHPKELIHPSAVRVLREQYGVDIADQPTRHLDTVVGRHFDYVITLCDKVREVCPEFPGHPRRIHWSVADPAQPGADALAVEAEVRRTARDLDTRITHLLHVLRHDQERKGAPG